MDEIISSIPVAEVNTDTIVEIDSKLPIAQVDVTESITVEIQPETYVLTSSGMYTGNMTGAVPTWILNAIQEQLTTGDGNLMSVLDDIKLLLDGLQIGVNQSISQIENTNISMSALETSVVSRLNGNDAAILDIYATRVTATEAQAVALQAIGSTFNGNVDAYIGNLASTYTNATSATATNIRTLQASYNNQTARIDTIEEVTISQGTAISVLDTAANTALSKLTDLEEARDGVVDTFYVTTAPASGISYGDYWVDTDSWTGTAYVVYRYEALDGSSTGTLAWRVNTGETAVTLGKAYRANVLAGTAQSTADGKVKTWYQAAAPTGLTASDVGDIWVDTDAGNLTKTWSGTAWVDIINTQSNTAYTWSATASKLITAPDGSVTGWSFGDGSNTKSNFKIKAENFSISDGTTGYTPFSITGTDINFLGKVRFSSVTGTPTHTSGTLANRPTTAVLGSTYVATDESNKLYTYTATGWKVGGATSNEVVADINNGNTTTIDGGKITTGSIAADKINTNSLVAENIRSTSVIKGNTIEGSYIKGARIDGAVIKASYLDLDGELEVLTDYHISSAMYSANPALYTDAVYIKADNEYRIPTLSSVSSGIVTASVAIPDSSSYSAILSGQTLTRNKVYNSLLYPYNVANINSNIKSRRIRPYFTSTATTVFSGYLVSGGSFEVMLAAYVNVYVYFGDTLLLHVYGGSTGTAINQTGYGAYYANGVMFYGGSFSDPLITYTVTVLGFTFTIKSGPGPYYSRWLTIDISEISELSQLSFDFINSPIRVVTGENMFVNAYSVTTPKIYINNML